MTTPITQFEFEAFSITGQLSPGKEVHEPGLVECICRMCSNLNQAVIRRSHRQIFNAVEAPSPSIQQNAYCESEREDDNAGRNACNSATAERAIASGRGCAAVEIHCEKAGNGEGK